MEGLRNGIAWPTSALVVLMCTALIMLPEVSSTRYIVGDNMGWTSNVNYTIWAQGKHFYNGDWLFFVYDRHQMDVLEVNKTNYETCNSEDPIHNWTLGAGRDVVPLNMTRPYYFISGKGFCYGGMKLALHVENLPPPPTSAPFGNKKSKKHNVPAPGPAMFGRPAPTEAPEPSLDSVSPDNAPALGPALFGQPAPPTEAPGPSLDSVSPGPALAAESGAEKLKVVGSLVFGWAACLQLALLIINVFFAVINF